MADREYRGTLDILWPKLEDAFGDLSAAQMEEAVDALEALGAFTPTEPPPEDHRALDPEVLGPRWYAIHDSELKLYESLGRFLSISTGGIAGLVAFWNNYRRKRIALTGTQASVLLVLKQAGNAGATVAEIAAGRPIPEAEVAEALSALLSVRREDGTLTALVAQDGERWIRLDV